MEKIITVVAKPFTAFPRGKYEFMVQDDGTVRVYNWLEPGTYTVCHSLSERAQQRIRKIAALA